MCRVRKLPSGDIQAPIRAEIIPVIGPVSTQSIPLHPSVIPHHPADSKPSALAARLRRSCAMQSLILCSANLWIGQGETSTEGRLWT